MAEKNEKSKILQNRKIPKDAQVIMSMMKDMGIKEYEPKVINQLLEFTYKHVSCIFDDSRVCANHAKKKVIDLEDVELAVKMRSERSFTNPPPRDVLLEMAKPKNDIPLPSVKVSDGLRLPPDLHCLISPNYKFKNVLKGTKIYNSMLRNNGHNRIKIDNSRTVISAMKRPIGSLGNIPRTQISIQRPLHKISTVPTGASMIKPTLQLSKPKVQITTAQTLSSVKIEPEEPALKKPRGEDYDAL